MRTIVCGHCKKRGRGTVVVMQLASVGHDFFECGGPSFRETTVLMLPIAHHEEVLNFSEMHSTAPAARMSAGLAFRA